MILGRLFNRKPQSPQKRRGRIRQYTQLEYAQQLLFLVVSKEAGLSPKVENKFFRRMFGPVTTDLIASRKGYARELEGWMEVHNIKVTRKPSTKNVF